MPRQKKQDETGIGELDITSTVGTETNTSRSVKGLRVSLNTKMQSFFGISNIWLSYQDHSCVIPDTLTIAEENIVKKALDRGVLVEGDVKIQPIERHQNVLDEYWNLIKIHGLDAANEKSVSLKKFRALYKSGVDRNWTAKEIANYCYRQEQSYKNRKPVLKLLEDIMLFGSGPDTLLEE